MRRAWWTVAAVAALGVACVDSTSRERQGGEDAADGGTLVIAMPSEPGSIFPPFALNSGGRLIAGQIYDHLADVGPDMNTIGDAGFRPQLADRWTWSPDSLAITFHLNPQAKWHDGAPVTARDVRFTFDLYRDTTLAAGADELKRIDSVTTPDARTVVYWFSRRSPTQFLDAAAQVQILPAHLTEKIPVRALRENPPPPIGSGRFRFKRREKGSSGELVADSGNYRGRARLDRVVWTVSPDATASVARLLSGAADVFDALRPEDVRAAQAEPELRVMMLEGLDYVFLQFNLRDAAHPARPHPLFADRNLRRAITMAVDRERIVRSLFDTLAFVPVGPTVRAYPTTDPGIRQLPFDPVRAQALLDSLGWVRPGVNTVRRKNGRPLEFTTLLPSSSKNRVRAGVLIQSQLRDIGIEMRIESMEHAAFASRWSGRRFDAALASWNTGSTPGATPLLWGSRGLGSAGNNFGSYSNAVFDAQLDSALAATNLAAARELFTRAYHTINDDAPAIWLYEPRTLVGVHRRLRIPPIRRGWWWAELGNWFIPLEARLERDRIR